MMHSVGNVENVNLATIATVSQLSTIFEVVGSCKPELYRVVTEYGIASALSDVPELADSFLADVMPRMSDSFEKYHKVVQSVLYAYVHEMAEMPQMIEVSRNNAHQGILTFNA